MNLIAAVDKNWAIGRRGQLLVSIPGDQQLFRQETVGKVIVMGRKTLESLPGGQPLAGRTNVVLTRDPGFQKKGCEIFHSLGDALEYLKQFAKASAQSHLSISSTCTFLIPNLFGSHGLLLT